MSAADNPKSGVKRSSFFGDKTRSLQMP